MVATAWPSESERTQDGDAEGLPIAVGDSIDRYRIRSELGRGGMGIVYAAYDPELDREVAIKLLRRGAEEDGGVARRRLLAEAQAMASLAHPHVVPVYDVGASAHGVYVVMELVHGTTLAAWMRQRRRTWVEIVAVFADAAAGLAAAHAADIVHRDFKPSNVIVGEDGRARVMDFGIAATAGRARALQSEDSLSGVSRTPNGTKTGMVVGTPAYMAPEQAQGGLTQPASDQFSYCVALYEALYGVRPFAGSRIGERSSAIAAGEIQPRQRGRDAPRWLYELVVEGLAAEPARRHASMQALLERLEDGRRRSRRRRAITRAAGGVVIAAGVGFAAVSVASDPACTDASQRAETTWLAAREDTRRAFERVDATMAGDAWPRFAARLDANVSAWTAEHRRACELAASDPERTSERDAIMACLNGRLAGMETLLGHVRTTDRTGMPGLVKAAATLESPASCAETLERSSSPAADRLHAELERAKTEEATGAYDVAATIAERTAQEAAAIGHTRLEALAHEQLGRALAGLGDDERGQRELERAYLLAVRNGYDPLAARAAVQLVYIAGYSRGQPDVGHGWAKHARAAVERAGGDAQIELQLESNLGSVYTLEEKLQDALEHYRRALELARTTDSELGLAMIHNNIGSVLDELGDFEGAVEHYWTALDLWGRVLGPHHPDVALAVLGLGTAHADRGHFDAAVGYYEDALEIWVEAFGAEHPRVAVVHSNVGLVRRQQGNLAGALAAFDEAERILSKADGGAAHPNIAVAWFGRGSVHEALGHPDRAREDIQRAIDLWLGQFGEVHPHVAGAHAELSGTYLAEGELDRAEEAAGRSVELFERALGGDHPLVAVGLASLGAVALERGDFTGAVASYTRALRLRTDTPVSREELAAARFGLARARAGANPADPEAEALARQALEGLGDAPGFDARGMSAEIRQWLAKRERLAR